MSPFFCSAIDSWHKQPHVRIVHGVFSMLNFLGAVFVIFLSTTVAGAAGPLPNFTFKSIDGGEIQLSSFKGKPILISNTASKCGFTGQYKDLQALHEKYSNAGLIVLGVPSKDFRQEYDDNQVVKEFCEVNFGITFPIAEVTHVIGKKAHPFYRWLVTEYNLKPRWNFTKILIDRQGEVIASFGSTVRPNSQRMQDAIVEVLKK